MKMSLNMMMLDNLGIYRVFTILLITQVISARLTLAAHQKAAAQCTNERQNVTRNHSLRLFLGDYQIVCVQILGFLTIT
jgi:hypothetical protein